MTQARFPASSSTVPAGASLPGDASLGLYAVSLARAEDRWASLSAGFGHLPWRLERVLAPDAAADAAGVLAERGMTIRHPPTGVGWNPLRQRHFSLVEEACFCGHLRALRRFLASGNAYGLILEDDAVPTGDIAATLSAILASGVAFDVVKLEGCKHQGGRLARVVAELPGVRLVRSFAPASGAAAYLVTRAAAVQLIERAGRRLVPFDDYLNASALHGCRVVHGAPWAVLQSGAKSTMGQMRQITRYKRRRNPLHFSLQGLRRLTIRLDLWLCAAVGLYNPVAQLRFVPWAKPAAAPHITSPGAAPAAALSTTRG